MNPFTVSASGRASMRSCKHFLQPLPPDWTERSRLPTTGSFRCCEPRCSRPTCIAAAAISLRQRRPMRRCAVLRFLVHHPPRRRRVLLALMPRFCPQRKDFTPWLSFARSSRRRERPVGRRAGASRDRTGSRSRRRATSRPKRTQRTSPQRCSKRASAAASAIRAGMICAASSRPGSAYLRERGDHAPTTLAGYEHWAVLAARHLGHVPLTRLTPRELDQLYAKLLREGGEDGRPLSRRSVLHVHRLLHTALGQAKRWRLIGHNPAADAKAPTVPFKQARGFTPDEIDAAAGRRGRAAIRRTSSSWRCC